MNLEKTIFEAIEKHDVITIFGHMFPDGDCYGSQLGLKNAIIENYPNKKVYALGSGFKKMIKLCGEMDKVDDSVISSSLAIVLDCSTVDRVEDPRYTSAKEIIHIDHHVNMHSFSGISLVDESAIATTEVLTNLFVKWNYKLSRLTATPLMLGLITDSGRFMYGPSKTSFACASLLIENGAMVNEIYNILYESDIKDLATKKLVYSSYNLAEGVIYTLFDKETLRKIGGGSSIASQTVNLLSSIKDFPVWASFAEAEDGTTKCEFRCKKGYSVSEIAINHGGGGHTCASGCSIKSIEEVPSIVKELEMIVKEQKFNCELKAMIEAITLARTKILEVYNTDFSVEIKEDSSPVTIADQEADRIIKEYLSEKFPTYSFLTEESVDNLSRLNNEFVFIVDPVDGTKDFVAKNDEFTTNIALCQNHEIVVGVVSIPVSGEIYYAIKGRGSYYLSSVEAEPIKIHVSDKMDDLTLYLSRFHATDEEKEQLKSFPQIKHVEAHGSSIKACYIAHGKGELHYRFSSGTKEWDTAAIQIIVEEAGGIFVKPDGTRYTYNREDVYNREGYIITNRKENILIKK